MSELASFVDELIRLRRILAAALVGKPPLPSADFDRTRTDVRIFEELMRIKQSLLALFIELAKEEPETKAPRSRKTTKTARKRRPRKEDELLDLVGHAQRLLAQHPVAAQQAFSALVAEGRRFARTPAGMRWEEALSGSQLMRRARQVWESTLASFLEEGRDTVLPSSYVELLMKVTELAQPERFLARLPRAGRALR